MRVQEVISKNQRELRKNYALSGSCFAGMVGLKVGHSFSKVPKVKPFLFGGFLLTTVGCVHYALEADRNRTVLNYYGATKE